MLLDFKKLIKLETDKPGFNVIAKIIASAGPPISEITVALKPINATEKILEKLFIFIFSNIPSTLLASFEADSVLY